LIGLGREFAEPSGVPRRDECGGRKTIESFTSDAGVFYAYGASPSWDGYEFHVADSSFAGAFPLTAGKRACGCRGRGGWPATSDGQPSSSRSPTSGVQRRCGSDH
jgi:hypothetical protein